jgi:uncharacterized protein (TIGR02391 family)
MQDEAKDQLQMTFMPNTIEHLGARLYSTLPPVLSELIANAYDADASEVRIKLNDNGDKEIVVRDNGHGMTLDDINRKFLRIGRNRRDDESSQLSLGGRPVIGKKGLGKLSFFGIAHIIEVSTVKEGKRNTFLLDWNEIVGGNQDELRNYQPVIKELNVDDSESNHGTTITLRNIQRVSDFDPEALADRLSKIFIIEPGFNIYIQRNVESGILLNNERKYASLNKEVEWAVPDDIEMETDYTRAAQIKGYLIATKTPISPSTNMRGITLFSRKKMVNLPEYFSESTSSHFYSYLTGWLEADFIDDLDEDVIETNRQSLNWDHPEIAELKLYLQKLIRWLESDWRQKRAAIRDKKLAVQTDINVAEWKETIPEELVGTLNKLIKTLDTNIENPEKEEDAIKGFKSLYKILPPYASFHWRHLHPSLQAAVFDDYKAKNYYYAVFEGVKTYVNAMQLKSGSSYTGRGLLNFVFPSAGPGILSVTDKFKRLNGTDFDPLTIKNIKEGHTQLCVAMWQAFRDPISHETVEDLRDSGLYTEQDCLDALSLLSHLFCRLDNAVLVS